MSVFLLALVAQHAFRSGAGPWRIDEAHKVADTWFYRLFAAGDFTNDDWLRHIVDRTNPFLPKFLYGAAISLQGAPLPSSLAIREELPNGALGQRLTSDDPVHLETLAAGREVSMFVTALTAALLFTLARRTGGNVVAFVAVALYGSQFLVQTFAATFVYDPLLTLAILLSAFPLLTLVQDERARISTAILLTLSCAFAFQIRISGIAALIVAVAMLTATAILRRRMRLFVMAVMVAIISPLLGLALNPYFWVPATPESLWRRVTSRVVAQLHDLGELQARELARSRGFDSAWRRWEFIHETLFGDVAGLILLLGCVAAAFTVAQKRAIAMERATLLWSAAMALVFFAWLPLPWPRYLLVTVPPLCLIAAFGLVETVREVRTRNTTDEKRASLSARPSN